MNFFLDSTIFQNGKDIFFNNRFSREFFSICRQQNFSVYISTVVIEEIRRQFNKFISDQLYNIRAGVGAINVIPDFSNIHINLPSIDEIMFSFDSYFTRLKSEGIVYIVPYSNDFLPELIHRSIHRIKPFTEAKQEFRDAIIWFSYAQIAEDLRLENCYLISGNTTDYLNKQGQLYKELTEKSNRFTLFKDIYSLLNAPFMEPFKATHALLESLKQKEWDLDEILNFLKQVSNKNYIQKYLTDDKEGKLGKELSSNLYYSKKVILDINISDITSPSIRGVDYINNEFIISGMFEVNVEFMSLTKNYIPGINNCTPDVAELIIFFDVAYIPVSNTYKNLEINSYENANEYWEGVHRIREDTY